MRPFLQEVAMKSGVRRWLCSLLWLCAAVSGCARAPESAVGFQVDFACEGDRLRAEMVIVKIAEGPCPLTGESVYQATITRGATDQAPTPEGLSSGVHAFAASALDASGQEVARTCSTVSLPTSEVVTLTLEGASGCGDTTVASEGVNAGASDADVGALNDAGAEGSAAGGALEMPLVALEQDHVLRGKPVPVRYVNAAKSRKPFIAIYREAEASVIERFVIPFARGVNKASGSHSFQALPVGSYFVRLVYDDQTVVDEQAFGVVDDRDADGTPDPDDGCPDDRLKVAPLSCGCGVPEGSDADKDGTVDCADHCPYDAAKIEPGSCGCGFLDSKEDSDKDGTSDCYDVCPMDPSKIAAMQCGCGRLELDRDQDGSADCVDGCADDALKVRPGQCGCGRADQDSDGDASPDCLDQCPADVGKVAKGICGCGVSDKNTDGDSLADCLDKCPNDASKVDVGLCGCGVPDTDRDGDGAADCRDGCPNDGAKRVPGVCGCGRSDADRDGDGFEDCRDGCPQDSNKTAVGVCGCGKSDTQLDVNGTVICRVDPASCLEILTKDPLAADGTYLIDPDARGAAMPMQVSCDMKKGGFTVIGRDDFQAGQSLGWTAANGAATPVDRNSTCAKAYGPMLGGYELLGVGAETRKTFDLFSIPHTEAWLTLDYFVLDSWEAEDALVFLDGVQKYRATFDAKDAKSNVCGGKKGDLGPQKVDIKSAHTKNTILVRATSTINTDASDESFGIANVVLRVR